MDKLRIGCVGAARIAPMAVVRPARAVEEAELRAVAARDEERARRFAGRHGVPVVHPSYEALVEDPELDAVYVPLPNGLHARWTIRAVEAGKHVLCEKPFTSNAAEAQVVAERSATSGLVVMEAFHWRYHPLAEKMLEVVRSGELGEVQRIEAAMCFPLPRRHDIRWDLDLAGGALMDAGCYAVHMLRTLAGEEPEVVSARAKLRSPGIDRYMRAELRLPSGASGRVTASMWSSRVFDMSAKVVGDKGQMRVLNPVAPQYFHLLSVRTPAGTRRERVPGPSTYECQLRAFVAAVLRGEPILTPPSDSVANMSVIDAIYRAAGMEPRPGAARGAALDPRG